MDETQLKVSFLLDFCHHFNEMDHAYKSQLQTYALKQNLELPVYTTEREGPPHAPRFKCRVTFSGQTFQTQEFFPTLKAAEHAAAKLALASLGPQSSEAEIKMDHLCKSQLQTYALKQNLDLPVYATEREGPPHAPRFKCKVTFCGQTFQSQEFFPTLKSAEHSAAKIALASLLPQSSEGINDGYKNLLQEIAQKVNSPLPVYVTATSGPSHAPTFISTVEFAGKTFRGEEAKIKKVAEMSAAKVAFMSIKDGNLNQASSSSLPYERQEAANSCVKTSPQQIHSQPSKMVTPDVPSKWVEVYEDELPDVQIAPASNAKEMNVAYPGPVNPTNCGPHSSSPTNAMMMNNAASSSPLPQNPTYGGTPHAPATNSTKMNIAASPSPSSTPQNPTYGGTPHAPATNSTKMNIAASPSPSSTPQNPTYGGTPYAPATNSTKMNIAASPSPSSTPQNPTNGGTPHASATNSTKMNIAASPSPSSTPQNPTYGGTHHAPVTNSTKMNIAASPSPSSTPQNPTNGGTPHAPATNTTKINIPVSPSFTPQNPSGNETSSCVKEESEKKLIMGTGHPSIQGDQHIFCCPWKPEMTLPPNAEMLFRDDRFMAYRLVEP